MAATPFLLTHALPRDPAVSRTHIAFVEAGQLWVMPRSGGVAARVSDLPGRKYTPRFSPDGEMIAFGSNEAQSEANLYTVAAPWRHAVAHHLHPVPADTQSVDRRRAFALSHELPFL